MKKLLSLTVAFLSGVLMMGQELPDYSIKIDSLFLSWNTPNHPGGAIGIMKDGQIIYSKAFGLASLEYLVPNTPQTIFNTGSVSKQLTAMGIVKLEDQGKLSFDDDVRKYVPELPDFGKTITIRHLMHHTSGLRSLHALFALAGWRGDDSRTNEDLNRIIQLQKELNFEPGSQYTYCNTGYMLMVNIIEKVAGQKFTDYMKSEIFDPLGMHQTYVEDQYSRIVPHNATSYYSGDDFSRAVEYWGYVGSGNMHSTTDDLLNWLKNFYKPQPGWESAFKKMLTKDPFNDGTPNNYAFGVTVAAHLGYNRVSHGGAIGGFRAFSSVYPEQQLSIVVLTNFSRGNPGGKATQIAKILLGENQEQTTQSFDKFTKIAPKLLQSYQGSFWNEQEKYSRKIYLKDDTLRYWRSEDSENALVPLKKSTFQMVGIDSELYVEFEGTGNDRKMLVSVPGEQTSTFTFYEPQSESTQDKQAFEATYYSPEVETSYRFYVKNDTLMWHHGRHGDQALRRIRKDVYGSNWPLNVVELQRNEAGNPVGIKVSNGRVRNLWFERRD